MWLAAQARLVKISWNPPPDPIFGQGEPDFCWASPIIGKVITKPARGTPKSLLDFFLIFLTTPYGGLYRGPPLKTRFWEDPGYPDYPLAESRKKVRPPPSGGWSSGGFPTFLRKLVTAWSGCLGSYLKTGQNSVSLF